MRSITVLSPTAILGYGFPRASFEAGLAFNPHVIAVDAGSTDPGPYYLGAGVSFTDREAVKCDLRLMLTAARARNIPVVIGSAGGSGARPHVAWTRAIIDEIARDENLSFRLATVEADIDPAILREAFAARKLAPLEMDKELTAEDLAASTHVVAQMGVEPLLNALKNGGGADVVLAGRCYDPAVFAAVPMLRGFDHALALHMGKILECAAIACSPGSGSDCLLGVLDEQSFTLHALNPARRCTVSSIAAHTLYEKSDPMRLPGPGGVLDLAQTTFEQVDANSVRVAGSRHFATPYALKLEGARRVGFRTVSIAGVRDPIFIAHTDEIAEGVRNRVVDNFRHVPADSYRLLFRFYGKDAVMQGLEPVRTTQAHELGIVIEAVANTQELANTICGFARSTMLHYGYKGRISTAGNLAFPYSPSDFEAGEVYEFSVYHLMQVADPLALFPVRYETVGRRVMEAVK
jgi:hypothetical protein